MRDISPELEAKLKQAMQTAYNNAEPKMEVYLGQAGDLLSALARFRVLTIHEGTNLGKLDIGVKRPDKDLRPTEMHIAYIQDGVAKVCYQPMPITAGAEWIELYTVGEAVDVALEFDGRWVKHEGGLGSYVYNDPMRFLLQTDGDPWVFWVTAAGALYGKQGASGTTVELAPDGVTGCSAIRGWKNLELGDVDQGLIVAYIRTGQVCYRNYAEQADGLIIWEVERVVPGVPTPAEWVSLENTHDYRTGLKVKVGDLVHYYFTGRAWALMAVDQPAITVSITNPVFQLTKVDYIDTFHEEQLTVGVVNPVFRLLYGGPVYPVVAVQALELSDTQILLTFNVGIRNPIGQEAAFAVTDSKATPVAFAVVSTEAGSEQNQLILTTARFNNAEGALHIAYDTVAGGLTGEDAGQDVASFDIGFIPSGLVPDVIPPVVAAIYNLSNQAISIKFDRALAALTLPGQQSKFVVSGMDFDGLEVKQRSYTINSTQAAPAEQVNNIPSLAAGTHNKTTGSSVLSLAEKVV